MKYFFAGMLILFSTISFADSLIRNCNLPTASQPDNTLGRHAHGPSRDNGNYISSSCADLGTLSAEHTILDCRAAASRRGYDCYQVVNNTWARLYVGIEQYQNCWACLND